MADNVNITPGSGAVIATDEVTLNAILVQIQRMKAGFGADGSYSDVEAGNGFPVSPQRKSFTNRSGTITTGGTAQTLAAANANRGYFFIQNHSTGDLWIDFGATAVQSQPSIRIPSEGSFVLEGLGCSTEAVSVIGAATGQAFTAKEMI